MLSSADASVQGVPLGRSGSGCPSWLECVNTHTRPSRDTLNLRLELFARSTHPSLGVELWKKKKIIIQIVLARGLVVNGMGIAKSARLITMRLDRKRLVRRKKSSC